MQRGSSNQFWRLERRWKAAIDSLWKRGQLPGLFFSCIFIVLGLWQIFPVKSNIFGTWSEIPSTIVSMQLKATYAANATYATLCNATQILPRPPSVGIFLSSICSIGSSSAEALCWKGMPHSLHAQLHGEERTGEGVLQRRPVQRSLRFSILEMFFTHSW